MIEGKIGIPNSYFLKMAKHDYEDYNTALPREFYQNSIDAGAKNIIVKITEESRTITVYDDGCGMSLDTLQNKLLILGGSLKGEGAVGAFGKAKEVLFFSWDKYTITTNDHLVQGCGAEYTINLNAIPFNGTECTITLPDTESFSYFASCFERVAAKMQTKTKIFINGIQVECIKKRGKAVRIIEEVGTIHQLKKIDSPYMEVRINGIWMFSMYVGYEMGSLILELSGSSTDVLTSNRDGFKWEIRQKVSALVEELTTNKSSALQKNKAQVKVSIPGNGAITVGEEQLVLAKTKIDEGHNLISIVEQVFRHKDELTAIQSLRIKTAAKITEVEWDDFKKHIEFIGYEPDFTLLYEEGKEDGIAKFMTTKKAKLLAIMWTEIIKQILMDNKRYLRFTAGFDFNKDNEAGISCGEEVVIYLNPNHIKISEHRRIIMEDIKDLAIHEIAHLKCSNHNEPFVNEMADIRKNVTRADQKSYSDIQRTKV